MRVWLLGSLIAGLICALDAGAQTPAAAAGSGEPVAVFTDHPRLFLRPARLRLLRREKERGSPRWMQLEAYVSADAPMPESAFAQALYYQISGDTAPGRKAVAWALGPGQDLRQLALVFDWCQGLLKETEAHDLAARLSRRIAETENEKSVAAIRARVLAAVALYDHVPDVPARELQKVVRSWWEGEMVPALSNGRVSLSRTDIYPLWEIFHAIRDSANLDLRESSPRYFKNFPIEELMSYYPATFPAEDNDFHIGASQKIGQPDLELATFSRAAELAMVAFDTNAEENQYVQGWLMHDRFSLRSSLGAPYEFLWANPYQPGLSFSLLPLVYHNPDSGTVFVRSDWEESADWFGYFDGVAQLFREGRVQSRALSGPPLTLSSAVIYFGAARFRVKLEGQQGVIVVGLEPNRAYQIEIDDEELFEEPADWGGILMLDLLRGREVGVRLKAVPR
jgi:hypothetical protein